MELAIVFGLLIFLVAGMILYGRDRVERNEEQLRRREEAAREEGVEPEAD